MKLEQNALYNKRENSRYLIKNKLEKVVKRDMTFILGARCADGVVLVGDTKITLNDGTNYEYGQKLFRPFYSVVLGASGASGLYASFQNRMEVEVRQKEAENINLNDHEKVKILAENVIRKMHKIYEQDRYFLMNNLNVLMAIRVNAEPELVNITGEGLPEPVNSIKVIGHGEPHGALFINKMWRPTMTMEQTAKLALFIIKLIEETQIDASVGYRSDCLPQVYYLPYVIFPDNWEYLYEQMPEEQRKEEVAAIYEKYPIQELKHDAVNRLINQIGSKVSDFNDLFIQGQFKL
jgi:20S proteasome alpha/beta subunit